MSRRISLAVAAALVVTAAGVSGLAGVAIGRTTAPTKTATQVATFVGVWTDTGKPAPYDKGTTLWTSTSPLGPDYRGLVGLAVDPQDHTAHGFVVTGDDGHTLLTCGVDRDSVTDWSDLPGIGDGSLAVQVREGLTALAGNSPDPTRCHS